jgi:hypothetical protein
VRSAIIFLVLLFWPLSLPSAASASPMSLYGPWHDGQRGGPVRSVTLRTFSGAVGGAATAIQQLASARDRLMCIEGGLGARPLFISGQSP